MTIDDSAIRVVDPYVPLAVFYPSTKLSFGQVVEVVDCETVEVLFRVNVNVSSSRNTEVEVVIQIQGSIVCIMIR